MNDYVSILREKLPEFGGFPACYAFSIHKAGSTMMHKMIKEVCAIENIPAISIPDLLFEEGVLDSDWREDASLVNCFPDGRLYFGFRYLPEVLLNQDLNLRSKKSVLLVRDPRDALVSEFFSYGGGNISHVIPEKNGDAYVTQYSSLRGIEIDRYIIEAAPDHKQKLQAYLTHLNPELTKVFRYEDVFFDKGLFLSDIFEYFSIPVALETIWQIARQNDIRPIRENPREHIRKGTPGDYAIKLKPETIESLNITFRDIYAAYGYDLR